MFPCSQRSKLTNQISSTSKWVGGDVAYPCKGIIVSLTKEDGSDTCITQMDREGRVLNEANPPKETNTGLH